MPIVSLFGTLEAQLVENLPAMQEIWICPLVQEDPLEKGMATHSSVLPWRIPWTEEPGGLQSKGWQRVGHNWATNTFTFTLWDHEKQLLQSLKWWWSQVASACNGLELGLGSQPETGLGPSTQTLATRPVVSDKGPGPSALQERILTKTESRETSIVFIKRKKSTVRVDRHTGRLRVREWHPHGSSNYFYGAFLPGFLWPFWFTWFTAPIWYISVSFHTCRCIS